MSKSIFRIFICLALIGVCLGITEGQTTVTTAGVPVRITTTSTDVVWLEVQAKVSNTGTILIGFNVTPKFELEPGDSFSIDKRFDLSTLYLDADVSGDGITYAYQLSSN